MIVMKEKAPPHSLFHKYAIIKIQTSAKEKSNHGGMAFFLLRKEKTKAKIETKYRFFLLTQPIMLGKSSFSAVFA